MINIISKYMNFIGETIDYIDELLKTIFMGIVFVFLNSVAFIGLASIPFLVLWGIYELIAFYLI